MKNQRGFTLLETLLAVVITTLTIMLLLPLIAMLRPPAKPAFSEADLLLQLRQQWVWHDKALHQRLGAPYLTDDRARFIIRQQGLAASNPNPWLVDYHTVGGKTYYQAWRLDGWWQLDKRRVVTLPATPPTLAITYDIPLRLAYLEQRHWLNAWHSNKTWPRAVRANNRSVIATQALSYPLF